jgi:hypothetical protein
MCIVLPSNSSSKFYPSNTVGRYTTQLPHPIDLSKGLWEVALAEIHYDKSWYNVQNAYIEATLDNNLTKIVIEDGYYESNEQLINAINTSWKCHAPNELKDAYAFSYFKASRKCALYYKRPDIPGGSNFQLSTALNSILNLNDGDLIDFDECMSNENDVNYTNMVKSKTPMSLNPIYNMLVYSDIIEPVVVGDSEVPMLRSIPISNTNWGPQYFEPKKLHYIPIRKKELTTISVYIYTDFGELVPFTGGRTTVTLKLRRVRPLYIV